MANSTSAREELERAASGLAADFEVWCEREGIDPTLPARIAHVLLSPISRFPRTFHHGSIPRSLSTPSEVKNAWRKLLEWRHPRFSLNLLQLAIIFSHSSGIRYLWQGFFLRAENYRDESARLVNHPFHLALTLNPACLLDVESGLDHIPDELLHEEGTVDLTKGRFQRAAHWVPPAMSREMDPYQVWAPTATVVEPVFPNNRSGHPLQLIMESLGSRVADMAPFLHPKTCTALPLRRGQKADQVAALMHLIVAKLLSPKAQTSTVENLRTMLRGLRVSGITAKVFSKIVSNLEIPSGNFGEEVLILLCQLVWAVHDKEMFHDACKTVIVMQLAKAAQAQVPIERAAAYLPEQLVVHAVDLLKRENNHQQLEDTLTRVLTGRTLQGHCVLAVLQWLKGDVSRVHDGNELPDALKKLFHIPFQDLDEELKRR